MAAYEPALLPAAKENIYGAHKFHLTLNFGSSVLTSYDGKDLDVARTDAGKYTIYLPRTYAKRIGVRFGWGKCAAGAVYIPVVLTDAVAPADATTGGGTLVIETRTEAGTATDPADGDELDIEIIVSNDMLNSEYAGLT
jgi:hypothetical protein